MNRIVKVRIRAGNVRMGETQMIYPAVWHPEEVDMQGGCTMLNPNEIDVCMTGDIGRGGSEQWLIVALPVALALAYAEDPDIAIIDSIEADTIMETARVGNNQPLERVRNADAVNVIREKQKVNPNVVLTADEESVLNPDNPMKGINKTRRPSKVVMPDISDDLSGVPANKKEIQRG